MFIELAVGAGVVILGALALRRAKKRAAAALPAEATADEKDPNDEIDEALAEAKKRAEESEDAKKKKKKEKKKKKKKGAPEDEPPPRARPEGPRGLRVGDVLLYADTELWLAGEIHLDEEGFALSLFAAPGGARATHVVQLDAEAREVAFLTPTEEVPGGAVPTELPIDGLRLSLRRRGHADVRVEGEHLSLTTERAEYVILGGPGGKLVVVVDFAGGDRLALHGERVGREMYDVLPGGDDD